MTRKEKELIKKAIRLIHVEDDYHAGIEILCDLIGHRYYKFDGLIMESATEWYIKHKDDGILKQEFQANID